MAKTVWADPNLSDFYSRVARIEKAHAKGYGFEAQGTLGRSSTHRRQRSTWKLVKPLLVVLAAGFATKGVIHYHIGAPLYEERVAALMQGEGFDWLGGALMQADPATRAISSTLVAVLKR
ncbi:hypothetical protein Q9295_13045 [Xinfangfangia sp. CPCC 101601]|uniref:Uncharacterized protein n=1 Tax=Pseudogemmobacter lacusdianii TaxID=3069608 RepID=A0ABU0VZW0_9RHOB|nr:hypothetical protein [Xinfangfangia sp. CPCC 101601]MDQ2067297.1 hypothetical protein [Xinfangfangia sp. CPCC 101601]